jgi:predicted GNAT family N-acyltransferase
MMQKFVTWIRRKSAISTIDRELHPGMQVPVTFRPYASRDLDALLGLYDVNAAGLLPADTRETFASHLEQPVNGVFVGELGGKVMCCAGVTQLNPDVFNFCYGMVHPEYQKQRVGTTLTLLRIATTTRPKERSTLHAVIFAAAPVLPFYQRFGFVDNGTWKDSDGKEHPTAKLTYHSTIAQQVGSVLKWRKVEIKGEFQPHISRRFEAKAVMGKKGLYEVKINAKAPAAV